MRPGGHQYFWAQAFTRWSALAVFCLALGWAGAGEPIKFSTTDNKKMELSRPGANPLEKYLDRPFESLRPDSSLGPVVPPQLIRPGPVPALPEKTEREKAGWQNSWIFALPQAQSRQPTVEEIFKVERMGPDGRPQQKPTLMEQYFKQRYGRSEEGRGNASGTENRNSPFGLRPEQREKSAMDGLGAQEREGDPLGVRQESANPAMRSILDAEAGRQGSWSRGTVDRGALGGEVSLSDFFRASHEEMKREKLREEKRQEYRLMLESRTYQDLQQGRREAGLGFKMPGVREETTVAPSVLREGPGLNRELRPANPLSQEMAPMRPATRDLFEERRHIGGSHAPVTGPGGLSEPPRTMQQQRERPTVLPVPKRDF